jgi:uncharacterized membrane protein
MTNATVPGVNPKVTDYLARLNAAVGRLPHAEACDLVREIEVHISDKLEGRSNDSAVNHVLSALGTPEELAAGYRAELMLTRASRSFSPWELLRGAAYLAKAGAKGVVVFLLALFGYASGLALTITVLMKPFIHSVGLWVGDGVFQFGPTDMSPGKHEVLGDLYIPVVTVMAFVIVIGTTQGLRWLMKKNVKQFAR